MERMMQYISYLFLRFVCALIRLIPFKQAMILARFVGKVLFYVLAERRQIALDNLRHAFGNEKSEAEIREIAIKSFENLGMIGVEFIWIPTITKRLDEFVNFTPTSFMWKALEEKKGFVFTISHFGNWEWMAIASSAKGLPMNAVARPLRNRFVYTYIKKLRGLTGLKSINKKGAGRGAVRALHDNQVVAILIDQHEREASVQVPFFGRPAWTTTLPAILALKKDVLIAASFFYRERVGPSLIIVKEPFKTIRTGDYERDIYENTKLYVKAIEDEVRKRPGDWLWMHRRWR